MTHAHPPGAKTLTVKCKRCQQPFQARVADRKRGWGKFCSKSCKAIRQTQRTGYAGPHGGTRHEPGSYAEYLDTVHPFSTEALGQWEHTITFAGGKS